MYRLRSRIWEEKYSMALPKDREYWFTEDWFSTGGRYNRDPVVTDRDPDLPRTWC